MFLDEISSTVVQRDIDKLFKKAYKKTILITRLNKESLVVMSKKQYEKIIKASNK